jgi:hypothetical protein
MKSLLDKSTREELISRINSLSEKNKALWGKMNVYQMIKHCTLAEDMMSGKTKIKRVFIGRLLGPMFLKKYLKDERHFDKNSPTSSLLVPIEASGDIEKAKQEWINKIQQYENYSDADIIHPFFGRMTKDQIGKFVYKHADHHLRQFGA